MDLLLVDGNSLGYTQFHSGPPLVLPDGFQTQAVDGFIRALSYKLMERPKLLPVVLWDGRAQWRYDILPEYKSNRSKTEKQRADRAAYTAQVPHLQRALKHLGVTQLKAPNAEADDLSYQICHLVNGTAHTVELLSTDTDWWQLVSENISWQGCRRNSPYVTAQNFTEVSGYATPFDFIVGKAVKGDSADEIGGVGGVGDTTALQILEKYKSKEGFYAAVAKGEVKLTTKRMKAVALPESAALWERNLTLMDLSRAPKIVHADLQVLPGALHYDALLRVTEPLSLPVITQRVDELMGRFDQNSQAKTEFLEIIQAM